MKILSLGVWRWVKVILWLNPLITLSWPQKKRDHSRTCTRLSSKNAYEQNKPLFFHNAIEYEDVFANTLSVN